jgi:hypothetical protein
MAVRSLNAAFATEACCTLWVVLTRHAPPACSPVRSADKGYCMGGPCRDYSDRPIAQVGGKPGCYTIFFEACMPPARRPL